MTILAVVRSYREIMLKLAMVNVRLEMEWLLNLYRLSLTSSLIDFLSNVNDLFILSLRCWRILENRISKVWYFEEIKYKNKNVNFKWMITLIDKSNIKELVQVLGCATCGGGRKQSWPLFSTHFNFKKADFRLFFLFLMASVWSRKPGPTLVTGVLIKTLYLVCSTT